MNFRNKFLLLSLFLTAFPICSDTLRSFDDLFQGLTWIQRYSVFSEDGLTNVFTRNERPIIVPSAGSGIDLLTAVAQRNPSHMIETLLVVPSEEKVFTKLDAFNAIRNIKSISNYLYFNNKRNTHMQIFTEATRLQSDVRRNPIPDPAPAWFLPAQESMYIRIKDAFFGNLFFSGEFRSGIQGVTFTMSNFAPVRYLFFTIMKVEKFNAVIYMEPLEEGMLIYGAGSIDVPEFFIPLADINADIDRRINTLIQWVRDGLAST